MSDLFDSEILAGELKNHSLTQEEVAKFKAIAIDWNEAADLEHEIQHQQNFLQDFFGKILGYTGETGGKNNTMWWETGTYDSTRPDGILGFNLEDITNKDIRVVIELKGDKVKLDKKPTDQGFNYTHKVGGKCEWVIVSNFRETRLYGPNDSNKYHKFLLSELATNEQKLKEFHFLLSKGNLFTQDRHKSRVHNLLGKVDKGEGIEKRFYKHYSTLREEIWNNLIELNKDKHYGRNFYLYKAQKLIDRIIFIRFCKENGALEDDAVVKALDHTLIKGKYNRIKALFKAMDEGNPEIGIAKFNGGLFAPDPDLDNLNISDDIIGKIVILYSYNFGSDLDVNILGHIFEQSISDLESLTGDNEKKRKKDGVFYTPAYITEYIIKEAIGGWLNDKKAEIKAKQNSTQWWEQYAQKLKTIKVLDPACGSGAFLVKVFDYLQNQWQEVKKHIKTDWTYKDILTHNIYGVDINPASVGITKLSLWLRTARHKEPLTTLDGNIKIGNSLIDDPDIAGYYSEFEGKIIQEFIEDKGSLLNNTQREEIEKHGIKKSLAFNWHSEFPSVFPTFTMGSFAGKAKHNTGFDVVVGNPPYVSIKDIKTDDRRYYELVYKTAKFQFDIYSIFIERSFIISKSYVSFIIPVKYLSNIQFTESRKALVDNGLVKIASVEGKVFDEAQVDSIILMFKKDKTLSKHYENYNFTESSVELIAKRILPENEYIFRTSIDSTDLFAKIEENTIPLEKIADIRDGIAAGRIKDLLFLENPIDEFSKPLLFGKDIGRYRMTRYTNWVNYKTKEMNAEELKRTGKGRVGLRMRNVGVFERQKIVVRKVGEEMIATLDNNNIYCEQTLHCAHIFDENYSHEFILSLINSTLFKFYYKSKNSSGGKIFPQIRTGFMKQLPIPQLSLDAQQPFVEKAQAMLDLTKQLNELSSEFLKFLEADLAIKNITKKLEKWYNLTPDDFCIEVAKQNKNFAPISTQSKLTIGERKNNLKLQTDWINEFTNHQQKALALQSQITQTDCEIDKMVYVLYGLSEEEVAIIEASC